MGITVIEILAVFYTQLSEMRPLENVTLGKKFSTSVSSSQFN